MAKKKKKKLKVSSGNNRSSGLFGIVFRVLLIVAASALALAYLSTFINPAKIWFPSLFGIYYIPLIIVNFLLLIIAAIRRSTSILIPLIALIPSVLFLEFFFKMENQEPKDSNKDLKIITYNVGRFYSQKADISNNECFKNITNFLDKEAADVVTLQEFYIKDTTNITKHLKNYPYCQYYFFKLRNNYFFGNITFSKHPIIGGGKITFKRSTNLALYSDIEINHKTLRVYNNHLESFNIPLKSLISKVNERDYNEVSNELAEAYDKVILTNKKRAEQVATIVNHIKDIDNAIICGDLNDTPMSYTFHQLKKRKQDTFAQAGEGFGATYATLWPLLRIDFILLPKEFEATQHLSPHLEWSDHYPIIAKFKYDDRTN